METIQEKCDHMIGLLTKRNLERKLDIQKDRDDKELTNAENEKLDYFQKVFTEKRSEIENALEKSHTLKEDLAAHFDNISKQILNLQKYVAASNIFLRSYDIKVCNQTLQDLTNKAKDLEEALIPKRKFGFRNRKAKEIKANGVNGKVDDQKFDEVDACGSTKMNLFEVTCGFKNESNKVLMLEGDDIYKKDVELYNLENCKIKLFGTPSTVHMNYLKNCSVFCGPVSTSVFAENSVDCTFVIACQQLRLHSSKHVNIYLHVTSRAIMEDCNHIYVTPYNLEYTNIQDDFNKSGLNMNVNNWTAVDDFNWLNIEKKSPNWDILEETKRIQDWSGLMK